MGIIKASQELEINTIEIQHGQEGFNNPYVTFGYFPQKAVCNYPETSWLWGNIGYSRRLFRSKNTFHKMKVIGNPILKESKGPKKGTQY